MRQSPKPLGLLAASGLVFGATLVGCTAGKNPVSSAANVASMLNKGAAAAADAATRALGRNELGTAIVEAERAVGLSPRDAGYRSLLGNIYLKAGRFDSAEQAFTEVLLLNPGDGRAALSRSLAQIALGDRDGARNTLANTQGAIAAADLGLATALAGDPVGALAILEPAARAVDADGRVRQNLALAYALAGHWDQARIVGAQDISPVDLPDRLAAWADFARPDKAADTVPTLLGVQRAEDPGRPERLALIVEPIAPAEAVATVAPVAPTIAQTVSVEAVAAPVEPAAAFATPEPVEVPAVAIAEAPVVQAPAAAPAVEEPNAWEALAEVRAAARAPVRASAPKPTPELVRAALSPRSGRRAPGLSGRYVVQLGAYYSKARVESAWAAAVGQYGRLGAFQPSSSGVSMRGRTLHRLSVSGFSTSREAQGLCLRFRRQGGSCFVRTLAGDQPIRWAGRKVRNG